MKHYLAAETTYFLEVLNGHRSFELLPEMGRQVEIGDRIEYREHLDAKHGASWEPTTNIVEFEVTHIKREVPGLHFGWVVVQIQKVEIDND